MTVSRRHEPFRYAFEPAISCLIRLTAINHNHLDSRPGQAELLDLSPNGCKLESALNFHAVSHECQVVLDFELTGPIEMRGTILWQEQRAHGFRYGIRFDEDQPYEITGELKAYARQKRHEAAELQNTMEL
ncbi:PilZ domain-containing protein [Cohnella zeiphila]|uniref:PilZ domain-containing protein n=1 Tax=Cohnella zeiphila TaxID=2761120 RepID=A0A7X0SP61_9BACL|nr:PilZ domain-containing protein [Cohnella zeiphila]MBB6732464.1 PilZ domain-containing protein [Cohnella zeiphila]